MSILKADYANYSITNASLDRQLPKSRMLPFLLATITFTLMFASAAEALPFGAVKSYHNKGPGNATDFHVKWYLPTMASAWDRANDDWYANLGANPWDQNLRAGNVIPPSGYLTLFYAPGDWWFLDNLKKFNFTPENQTKADEVSIWDLFSFSPTSNPEVYSASMTFYNAEPEPVTMTNVVAWKDIDLQHMTVPDFAFQTGIPIAAIPSEFSVPAADPVTGDPGERQFDIGLVQESGYELVTGDAVLASIPDEAFYFGFASVVPEPATVCLLGLGGLALLRRRRA